MNQTIQTLFERQLPEPCGRATRIVAVAGLVLAYALVIPLRSVGYLPATVTWVGVGLVPALAFTPALACVFLPVATARQRRTMILCLLVSLIALLGAVYWQGWV